MPLGIPKVPYSRFYDEKPTWIDIYERLYKERTLFLCREITTSFTNRFIVLLLLLNSETDLYNDADPDIYIYMNSPGGGVNDSLTIYDTMETILPDVCTIAMGATRSVASLILAGGTITKRVALPHAKVCITQPRQPKSAATDININPNAKICITQRRSAATDTNINIDSLIIIEEEELELRNTIADIYAENTGKPVDIILKDMERHYDYFMSATEAQDYGIIDRIAKVKKGFE